MNPVFGLFEAHLHEAMDIPLDAAARRAWQDQFNQWPAVRHFALELDLSHSKAVRLVMHEQQPFHLGGSGDAGAGGGSAVNGAILASMFDGVLGVAGALQQPGRRAGTVELSIKFLRPVMGTPSAFGWALKRTDTMVFVEAILLDECHRRCAQANGIVSAAASPSRQPPAERSSRVLEPSH
ncbi:MAG TPA: PaaI family thioesterase [Ramlibacter sp.]|uniref:PaaI family thioesterase n=1 Tax=Ramlibacter sp. TaxID=1917967 RepID=UPI002CE34437|nr:PaaI family thioesterase [Ramlibacter sp.]HVZ45009.1 PaaI family thioesterase [Ramlibacter sp.]